MSDILYFLESATGAAISPEDTRAFSAVAPDGFSAQFRVEEGPGGVAGILLGTEAAFTARAVEYSKDRQKWEEWGEAGGKRVWCGCWTDSRRPAPEALTRPVIVEGLLVKLEDGNNWIVPRVRYSTGVLAGISALPAAVTVGRDGRIQGRTMDRYRVLEDAGLEAWSLVNDPTKANPDRLLQIAVYALGVNYRIGGAEVGLLQILTIDTAWNVVAAMVEIDLLQLLRASLDAQKKTTESETTPA